MFEVYVAKMKNNRRKLQTRWWKGVDIKY